MDFKKNKIQHKSVLEKIGCLSTSYIHTCHPLVIIFVLIDSLDYIYTVRCIALAERRTMKAIFVTAALARTACLTRTFGKFNHSSWGRHF